jgi:hypothetical protein
MIAELLVAASLFGTPIYCEPKNDPVAPKIEHVAYYLPRSIGGPKIFLVGWYCKHLRTWETSYVLGHEFGHEWQDRYNQPMLGKPAEREAESFAALLQKWIAKRLGVKGTPREEIILGG